VGFISIILSLLYLCPPSMPSKSSARKPVTANIADTSIAGSPIGVPPPHRYMGNSDLDQSPRNLYQPLMESFNNGSGALFCILKDGGCHP
jgi:hypothetical protein